MKDSENYVNSAMSSQPLLADIVVVIIQWSKEAPIDVYSQLQRSKKKKEARSDMGTAHNGDLSDKDAECDTEEDRKLSEEISRRVVAKAMRNHMRERSDKGEGDKPPVKLLAVIQILDRIVSSKMKGTPILARVLEHLHPDDVERQKKRRQVIVFLKLLQ